MTTTTSHPDLVTLEGHMRSWWCQHLGLFSIRDGNTGKDQERNLTLRTSSLESSLLLHYPFWQIFGCKIRDGRWRGRLVT